MVIIKVMVKSAIDDIKLMPQINAKDGIKRYIVT
jgi:hypothetical protein